MGKGKVLGSTLVAIGSFVISIGLSISSMTKSGRQTERQLNAFGAGFCPLLLVLPSTPGP